MQTYYAFPNDAASLAAQSALKNAYGTLVSFKGAMVDASGPGMVGLEVDSVDGVGISLDDLTTAIANGTGNYPETATLISPSNTGSTSGAFDLGNFLNNIGQAIKNAIPSLSGFPWLSILLVIAAVILFVVFFTQFSKGLGEGIAARA
jgi:hypothetical protein